jgi:hypothetical protein
MSQPDPAARRLESERPADSREHATSDELIHASSLSDRRESDISRRRRRARFLAELAEARELRNRVAPRRARVARMRAELRRRTFLV